MKRTALHAVALLAALPLLSGCFSIGGGRQAKAPRYALRVDRVAPKVSVDHSRTNALFVIGRVKSSRMAEGESIPVLDEETGRLGTFSGGRFAFPADVVVETATRTWLSRSGKFGIVVDASIAPRSKHRTILEGWIERFGLVRRAGTWSAGLEIRYIVQPPDGTFREIPLATETTVVAPVRDGTPGPEEVMRAFRLGLEKLLEQLEEELEEEGA